MGEYLRFNEPLRPFGIEPVVPSPGGVPPWDPPDGQGEELAYEGWIAWVQEKGNLSQRMALLNYRVEQTHRALMEAVLPSFRSAAESITKAMQKFGQSVHG